MERKVEMENKEKILGHLLEAGKANTYRIASALKISTREVTEALSELGKEGKVEIDGGVAALVKEGKIEIDGGVAMSRKLSEASEKTGEKKLSIEERHKLVLDNLKKTIKLLED